jgi:dethiobiotin synthetase
MDRQKVIVITGTDTGVGKTLVTACLARALRLRGCDVRVVKPFASGIDPNQDEEVAFRADDALLLRGASGMDEAELTDIRLRSFQAPLTPQTAAALEGRDADYDAVVRETQAIMASSSLLLIEGVGGVAVPITPGKLFSDFLVDLGAPPCFIVSRSQLGTINHTYLTVEHLRRKQVPILGLIFTRTNGGSLTLAEDHGPLLAAEITGLRSLGLIEHYPNFAQAQTLTGALCALPWNDTSIQGLADYILHPESEDEFKTPA